MVMRVVVLGLFEREGYDLEVCSIDVIQGSCIIMVFLWYCKFPKSSGIFIQTSASGVKRESVRVSFSSDQARLSKDTIQKRNFSNTRTLGLTGVIGSSR